VGDLCYPTRHLGGSAWRTRLGASFTPLRLNRFGDGKRSVRFGGARLASADSEQGAEIVVRDHRAGRSSSLGGRIRFMGLRMISPSSWSHLKNHWRPRYRVAAVLAEVRSRTAT
jgi:hypothetical protein